MEEIFKAVKQFLDYSNFIGIFFRYIKELYFEWF